jgi:hypothetical protein
LVSNLQILIVSGAVEISIANMTQADRSQTEEVHTCMLLEFVTKYRFPKQHPSAIDMF